MSYMKINFLKPTVQKRRVPEAIKWLGVVLAAILIFPACSENLDPKTADISLPPELSESPPRYAGGCTSHPESIPLYLEDGLTGKMYQGTFYRDTKDLNKFGFSFVGATSSDIPTSKICFAAAYASEDSFQCVPFSVAPVGTMVWAVATATLNQNQYQYLEIMFESKKNNKDWMEHGQIIDMPVLSCAQQPI